MNSALFQLETRCLFPEMCTRCDTFVIQTVRADRSTDIQINIVKLPKINSTDGVKTGISKQY